MSKRIYKMYVDSNGERIVVDCDGVSKRIYKVYVDSNGERIVVDCDGVTDVIKVVEVETRRRRKPNVVGVEVHGTAVAYWTPASGWRACSPLGGPEDES